MKRSNIDAMICRQEKITDITRETINKIQLDKLNAVLKREKERQGFQMRKFKTAEDNRTNYIYYTAEGKKVELKPGQDGVDETWIAMLHDWDNEQVDADRRED